MFYILVVSHNSNCRRLYVDNLVRRGYLAIGVASAGEAENLFKTGLPGLVLVCCTPVAYQQDINRLRTTYGVSGTLVLITQDKPDPAWAAARKVAVCLAELVDPRRLIETLRPWLPTAHGA